MDTRQETVRLTIADVAYRGKGLARTADGRVVFVAGVLPGEVVRAAIARRHKNFAEAELLSIESPSPLRIDAVCPLGGRCPGCCYQHALYEEEVRLKQAQLANLLQRMAGVRNPACLPPVPSPRPLGYRNKIVLHAAAQHGRKLLGYYAEDNASILEVPRCPLAVEPINERLRELHGSRSFLDSLQPPSRVTLRWTPLDGTTHWTGRAPEASAAVPAGWLREATAIGELRVPRGSFFQVNAGAAGLLLSHVRQLLAGIRPRHFIDLYCGAGVFALAAARDGVPDVAGVDSDELAVRAAGHNARELGLASIRFATAPAERGLDGLPAKLPAEETVLLVDPPRAGLMRHALERIAERRFAHVLYVSCAADTLARDLKLLLQRGYGVSSVRLVDMFPRTPYFESVTHLVREP